MIMNTAITGAEAAAGIASGGLTLLLTALVAVGAAAYEVMEKHEGLIASLAATHDAQQNENESTDGTIESIKNYIAAGGEVTPALKAWLVAEENLRQVQIDLQIATDKLSESALRNAIAEETVSDKTLSVVQTYELLIGTMLKKIGLDQLGTAAIDKASSSIAQQNLTLDKNKAQLQAVIVELQNLQSGNTKTMAQMTADDEKYWDAVSKENSSKLS